MPTIPQPPDPSQVARQAVPVNGHQDPAPATPTRRGRPPRVAVVPPVTTADDLGVLALYETLQREENPWELLAQVNRALGEHRIGLSNLYQFYDPFIALVARCPKAEADKLLTRGRDVFEYQMDTARADVAKLRNRDSDIRQTAFLATPEWLVEVVATPDAPPHDQIRYLAFDRAARTVGPATDVRDGGTVHIPPREIFTDTRNKVILHLPDGAAEYGTPEELFGSLVTYFTTIVYHRHPSFGAVLAAFTLFTWVYDRFDAVPYLLALGNYNSGKTQMLTALSHVVYRGIDAGGATGPVIYRMLHETAGVLCLDEGTIVDQEDQAVLRSIFLNGNTREHPIWRTEPQPGGGFRYQRFEIFGPKVLTSREKFVDEALASRCWVFRFPAVEASELAGFPADYTDTHRAQAAELRRRLLLWRFHAWATVAVDPLDRRPDLPSRLNQTVRGPLAITPPAWHPTLLAYFQDQAGEAQAARQDSLEGQITFALRALVTKTPALFDGKTVCLTAHVADRLNVDRPVREQHSADAIGRKLSAMGFKKPKKTSARGYLITRALLARHLAAHDLAPLPATRKAAE